MNSAYPKWFNALLVATVLIVVGCEEWEKNHDLTMNLAENESIDEHVVYNAFANSPLEIRFEDRHEGTFLFEENNHEHEFRFIEIDEGRYRVDVDGENQSRVIVVRNLGNERCMARFAESRTWIVYTHD